MGDESRGDEGKSKQGASRQRGDTVAKEQNGHQDAGAEQEEKGRSRFHGPGGDLAWRQLIKLGCKKQRTRWLGVKTGLVTGHSVCHARHQLEDGAMLVHSVYFWLKPDLTTAQRTAFLAALSALREVPSVAAFHLGTPAAVTARPVVDQTFDHSITCLFADLAAHDAYQGHALHQAFLEVGRPLWSRVQIYDAD